MDKTSIQLLAKSAIRARAAARADKPRPPRHEQPPPVVQAAPAQASARLTAEPACTCSTRSRRVTAQGTGSRRLLFTEGGAKRLPVGGDRPRLGTWTWRSRQEGRNSGALDDPAMHQVHWLTSTAWKIMGRFFCQSNDRADLPTKLLPTRIQQGHQVRRCRRREVNKPDVDRTAC